MLRLQWFRARRGGRFLMNDVAGNADLTARLEALCGDLAALGFDARIIRTAGGLGIMVINSAVPQMREEVTVALASDGVWWLGWSWGDRIAPITDRETAAFKIAYVLTPPVSGNAS